MRLADRPNLSQSVAAELREMIFTGELRSGEQINEVHLGARLGVSRTPLREALSSLVAEKAVEISPRRGFFVRPLSVEEAKDIFAIRPILDVEALRLAGIPPVDVLDRLDGINERLAGSNDSRSCIKLDNEWHALLLSGCQNKSLLELIENFVQRNHRYELAVMHGNILVPEAVETHAQISRALRSGDLEGGCRLLRHNLTYGLDSVLAWLSTRKL